MAGDPGRLLAERVLGQAPVTWVVENHDVARAPSRYGDGARGLARARAALLAVLGLPGSPYLYQGQELGLPGGRRAAGGPQDPAWPRSGRSRDGCRQPMPWPAKPMPLIREAIRPRRGSRTATR